MDFVATQAKIQLEAQESNEALKSFGTWLNEINEKDATLNSAKIRRRGVASQTLSSSNDNSSVTVDQTSTTSGPRNETVPTRENITTSGNNVHGKTSVVKLTPADIVESLKKEGNDLVASGEFSKASTCYSRALTIDRNNLSLWANRALCNLKCKLYSDCISDATEALRIDPTHIKSWSRRAAARNALGMHNAALVDLMCALKLDPSNRSLLADERKTQEMIRSAKAHLPETVLALTKAPREDLVQRA